jgi:hypothetical protein
MKLLWRPVAARAAALSALVILATLGARPAHADESAEHAAIIDRLIAKGSADSLATAALLERFGAESDTGSYPLVARAVQLAPDRRDLAWLAVRLCVSSSDCDDAVPEKHLRAVDPGNGIGSIGALTRAQRKNDAAAIDAALTAIGSSERFFVYFDPLVATTAPELVEARLHVSSTVAAGAGRPAPSGRRAEPVSPSGSSAPSGRAAEPVLLSGSSAPTRRQISGATVEMIGAIAASVLPPSQSFSYSCKGLALEQVAGRLDRCRRAAQAISRADAFIVEGLGLSLQQRLWPEDSPEGRTITAQRRVFQYRLEEYSRLEISSSKPDEFPADALDAFRTHEREQDVALAYFAKAGVPADPPSKWTSRSLPRVP